MIHEHSFLGRALVLSLILHAAVAAVVAQLAAPAAPIAPPAPPELKVSLREPKVSLHQTHIVPDTPAPARPRPLLPQVSMRSPVEAVPVAQPPVSPPLLAGEAALRAAEQLQRELLYPREAIERGLQGEALVLLFLDPSGNAIAARLESSSGHVLLDDAAVRAARTLRALPASAPRDVLLPVRFRLR